MFDFFEKGRWPKGKKLSLLSFQCHMLPKRDYWLWKIPYVNEKFLDCILFLVSFIFCLLPLIFWTNCNCWNYNVSFGNEKRNLLRFFLWSEKWFYNEITVQNNQWKAVEFCRRKKNENRRNQKSVEYFWTILFCSFFSFSWREFYSQIARKIIQRYRNILLKNCCTFLLLL